MHYLVTQHDMTENFSDNYVRPYYRIIEEFKIETPEGYTLKTTQVTPFEGEVYLTCLWEPVHEETQEPVQEM